MRRLTYTAAARRDLGAILEFLALQTGGSDVALSLVGKIRSQCAKLAALPGMLGRPRTELRADLRSFPFEGYLIFFRYLGDHLEGDQLEIVRIIRASRDLEAILNGEEPKP